MEIVKSDLENEIAAIFKSRIKKENEINAVSVLDSVLRDYFRKLETGNTCETYTTTDPMMRREVRDEAYNFIKGFIWAMDAAGLTDSVERKGMLKRLLNLLYPKDAAEQEAGTGTEGR